MVGARLLLLLLAVVASAGASSVLPAAQPGLLGRAMGLLGWGSQTQAEAGPATTGNVTAVVERFQRRLRTSITRRLSAVASVRLSAVGRRHHRAKRSLPDRRMTLDRDEQGAYVLLNDNGAKKVWDIPAQGAQHVHMFEDKGKTYALAAFGPGSLTSHLYELVDDVWTHRFNFSSFGAVQFTSFEHRDGRYVIGPEYDCTANRADKRGSVLYLFREGQLQLQHVLPGAHPTDVAIWSDYDTIHIGVSSEHQNGTTDVSYHVNSSIFKWTEGNFVQHMLPTYGARDLEHFRIQSHSFLAVANHRNNDGRLTLYSEILRYSLETGRYRSFQRLLTRGAVRFRHFSWGEGVQAEHFLMVANQADSDAAGEEPNYRISSVIYKFSQSQFVPFQCIPTVRARDVLPVWGLDGEFVLAVLDDGGLKLYQYTGWRFVLVKHLPLPPPGDGGVDSRLSAFTYGGYSHITVGSVGGRQNPPAVYRLTFEHRWDLSDLHTRCQTWCGDLRTDLTDLKRQVDRLGGQLSKAPRVDQPITFTELKIDSVRHSHFNRVAVDNVRLQENVTLNSGLVERLRSLGSRLDHGLTALGSLQDQLVGVVSAIDNHTFNQTVTLTGGWHVNTASAQHLTVSRLNSLSDVTGFLSVLVWTDRQFTDRSARLAFGRLRLSSGAGLSVGTLSHLRPSKFVTLSGNHVLTASKVLSGHVTAADLTAKLVNSVNITSDTVLVQGKLPAGVTKFGTLTVNHLRVGYINGIDIESVLQGAVSASRGQLPGSVRFAGPVFIDSASVRSINGVPVQRLLQRALTTTGGQNITGVWTVRRLHVDDDLYLTGTLNGLDVPGDLVFVDRPEYRYDLGSLSFSSVTVQQLTVKERLGPVRVLDGMLQLLLTSGDQLVVGSWTVGSLHLAGDSSVTGFINGVNISTELMKEALNQTTASIGGDKVIRGDVVFLSDLRLAGTMNGLDVPQMLRSALKLTDTSLPSMVFSELQISGDLRTSHLNGIAPSEWVTSSGMDQIITGDKTMPLLSAANITVDMLNGLLLDDFYGSVMTTEGDQHVLGPLLLIGDTVVDKVVANPVSWEGHNLTEEAVTIAGSHVIRGTKLYSAPLNVTQLQVADLWVDGLVDGANLTALLSHSAAAVNTTYMTVTGSQKFTSRVTAATLVVTGSVNGQDLLSTLREAVTDALVTGDLTFDAPVTVGELTFERSFDGVSSSSFGSDWLTSLGGQTLSGPLNFTSTAPVTVPALVVTVGGRLNGVEGGRLMDGLVPLQPGVVIRQEVKFKSLVAADVTLQTEGLNLTDAMRQNRSQLVLGAKVFAGGMYALNGMNVNGTVNGVHLNGLCERVVMRNAENTFSRLTVNGDVTLHRVPSPVSWSVNGVPLGRLESLYWLRDASQTLTGHVSLIAPYFTDVRDVQSLLSGVPAVSVDLEPYLENYWSLTRPQTVTGAVTFLSEVTVSRLTADRLTVLGKLNGKNLTWLADSVLTTEGGDVTGEWIMPDLITDSLSFTSINGIPASALLRTSDSEAHFTAHQTVRNMTVLGDVILPDGGLLYQLDVSEELDPASFLTLRPGPVEVTSDLVFGCDTVTFTEPLTVHGTINGVSIQPSALLTLAGQQRVPGVTRLTHVGGHCLDIPDLTAPVVNGIDLDRLLNHAVRMHGVAAKSDTPLNITGYWNFTHNTSVLSYNSPRSDTEHHMEQLLRRALEALQQMRDLDREAFGDHLTVVTDMYRALQQAGAQLKVASYLQYYTALQSWPSAIVRLQPVFLDGGDESPPAVLAAIQTDRVQLTRWRPEDDGSGGRWVDGPRYPERQVACLAGLRRADGTAYIAEARLAEPPAGVEVPDRVYRWDEPALGPLRGAVNYIFLYHLDELTQSLAMPSHKTVDVKSLKPSPAHDCFCFVHFSSNSTLVCYSDPRRSFVVHQSIPTVRAREASVYPAPDSVCVAVAGGYHVDLWCWDRAQTLLTRRQTIASAAVGVSTAEYHGRVLMAVTRADTGKVAGLVDVYRLEPAVSQFSHLQTVPVWAVRSAHLLVLPSDELLLACLTADGRIVYLQYRGTSGFEPRGELSVGHAATMEMFNMEGLETQMTVAGRAPVDMFALAEHYPAEAFSGKFMGQEW